MAADMGEDRAGTLGRNTLDDGQITLFRASGRELRRQGLVGAVIFCDDQAAGGVLVQAVDDARAAAGLLGAMAAERDDLADYVDLFGSSTPPMPERSPQWWSRAFTMVPSGLPAAGCTTMPLSLLMTTTSSSSYRMSRGIS